MRKLLKVSCGDSAKERGAWAGLAAKTSGLEAGGDVNITGIWEVESWGKVTNSGTRPSSL